MALALTLILTLTLTRYKPFLDRLSLDKVENIPRFITETATVLVAVTTNLFESYWYGLGLGLGLGLALGLDPYPEP